MKIDRRGVFKSTLAATAGGLIHKYDADDDERRLRVYYVSRLAIFEMFLPRGHKKILRFSLKDVPHDVEVEDVFWEPTRRAFGVVCRHSTFDSVSYKNEIPVGDSCCFNRKYYRVISDDSDEGTVKEI